MIQHRILTPCLLVLLEFIIYLSNDMYLPAATQMQLDLHISNNLAHWMLTSWFIGAALLHLIIGPITERYGRKPILLLGALIFITTTFICAISSNITILLFSRVFQGATVCMVVVASYSTIHELFDHKEAIQTVAWMNAATLVAPCMGPLFGGFLLYWGNWRLIFWILTLSGILISLLIYLYVPETVKTNQKIEIKSLLKQYRIILTDKDFYLNILALCFVYSSIVAWITSGSFLLIETYKFTPIQYSFTQFFIFVSFIIGTQLINLLMKITNTTTITKLGLCIALLSGIMQIPVLLTTSYHIDFFLILLAILFFGFGITFSPTQRLIIESTQGEMGLKISAFTSSISTFGVIGSIGESLSYHGNLFSLAFVIGLFSIVGLTFFTPIQLLIIPKKTA